MLSLAQLAYVKPISRLISIQLDKGRILDLRVIGEQKDPNEYDAKAIVNCALEVAALKLMKLEEETIERLKGDQSRKARATRKHCKASIEAYKAYVNRLRNPHFTMEVLGSHEPAKKYGVKSKPARPESPSAA